MNEQQREREELAEMFGLNWEELVTEYGGETESKTEAKLNVDFPELENPPRTSTYRGGFVESNCVVAERIHAVL